MKTFLLCILFSIPILLKGQKIDYPQYKEKDIQHIEILSIEVTDYSTIIKFEYTAPHYYINGGWVNLTKDIYLKDNNGVKYSLIRADGIPLSPNKHENSYKGQKLYFTAYFKKLPSNTSYIDIIECPNSNDCFNFYGVRLAKTSENNQFRNDYSHFSIYNPKSGWGEWQEGNNTIVFNTSGKGDITFYFASGSIETYRTISNIETDHTNDGESYQWTIVLDEKGNRYGFKLFEKGAVQLISPDGTIYQLNNFE